MSMLLRGTGRTLMGSNGLLLPYTADFTALPDGALPAQFIGGTWAITTGAAVNAPTLGADLLTGGNLEAAYSSGLCASLTKSVTPTVAESADVHQGTKAQEFTGTANNDELSFAAAAATDDSFYQYRGWGKRTAGSSSQARAGLFQSGTETRFCRPYNSASYIERGIVFRTLTTNNLSNIAVRAVGTSFETVIIDDYSLKKLTKDDLWATLPATTANVIIKVRMTFDSNGIGGIIARANARTSPTDFIHCYWAADQQNTYIYLDKCVSGTLSLVARVVVLTGGNDPSAAADLELRLSGTTAQLFYNNSQQGTDQTISDASIVSNAIHGMAASAGSRITRFFVSTN